MLDAIAERAAKLCDAENAAVFRVDGNFSASPPTLDRSPWRHSGSRVIDRGGSLVERLSTAKRSTSMTFGPPKLNFRVQARGIAMGLRTVLATPLLYVKVWPSVLFIFADERSVLSRTGKSSCSKPSPIRR